MATFGPPIVQTGNLADGSVTSAKIALDTVVAADVAANAIGDSEIAAHTTTKITTPFSLVTGTVGIAQGGTGEVTQTPAFDALSPLTTQGDIMYHNGTDNVRLGVGTNGQFLKTQGAGANPVWAAAGAAFSTGSLAFASAATARTNAADTYTKIKDIRVAWGGVVATSFAFRVAVGSPNTNPRARIYVNDAAVGTERTNTTQTMATFTEDITVVAGDQVQVYAKNEHASGSIEVEAFTLSANVLETSVITVD